MSTGVSLKSAGEYGLLLVAIMACLAGSAHADQTGDRPSGDGPPDSMASSFSLYTLSQGRGVPAPAREALSEARRWLEEAKEQGKIVTLQHTRVGLEGESRLCAEFKDRDEAQAMLERIRQLVQGVELMNLVVEPCADR